MREAVTSTVSVKKTWRCDADRVLKRSGKIFRSAMRISQLNILVTMFNQGVSKRSRKKPNETPLPNGVDTDNGDNESENSQPIAVDSSLKGTEKDESAFEAEDPAYTTKVKDSYSQPSQLLVNFYSMGASEAFEMIVTAEEQIERLGKLLINFHEGKRSSVAHTRKCSNECSM
jgi:hypothetical protein